MSYEIKIYSVTSTLILDVIKNNPIINFGHVVNSGFKTSAHIILETYQISRSNDTQYFVLLLQLVECCVQFWRQNGVFVFNFLTFDWLKAGNNAQWLVNTSNYKLYVKARVGSG